MSVTFRKNGLYILLSNIGVANAFHWGLYLENGGVNGIVYHLTNGRDVGYRNTWVFETKTGGRVAESANLLLALQIAEVPPDLHESLGQQLAAVPIHDSSTCRVWLLEALQILDEYGYIKLTGSTGEIEREALERAEANRRSRRAIVNRSSYSSA